MLQLKEKLSKREAIGNLRQLHIRSHFIDFSSNDYLGLARSPILAESMIKECKHHSHELNRLGSTGSRLLTGNSYFAQDLENKIAMFHGYEAGLLFNCGYMANLGILSAIGAQGNTLFFDAGVHASILEGIRLSSAQAYPFRHNDLEHLEARLKVCSCQKEKFICIESIYSTDGSLAPLREICWMAKKYHAHVIVDEAHAVGLRGPHGRGMLAEYNLTSHVFAQMHTFGKALGTHGAIVLGSNLLRQTLVNFASSFIYTTALPFYTLAAIQCSYDLFPRLDYQRQQLLKLIRLFQESKLSFSKTHIQSIPIKGVETIKKIAKKLVRLGFDIRPLLSPTVRRGCEVLRICLHAFNTEDELEELLIQLKQDGCPLKNFERDDNE